MAAIRLRRTRVAPGCTSSQKVQKLADKSAVLQSAIQTLGKLLAETNRELENAMRREKTYSVVSTRAEAMYERSNGRSSSHIPPRALMDLVELDEFVECVNVVQKRAAEFLTSKQLAKITVTEAAKPGDYKLSVKPKAAADTDAAPIVDAVNNILP